MMAYQARTIAKYFLSIPDDESGDLISNLKLQKLLYYSQGYYVGMNGIKKPLFDDKIYAWKHGPVVKTVYNHYAGFKSGALPLENAPPTLLASDMGFLNEIWRLFGRFSAWALRDMTHNEAPWKNNYVSDTPDIEISVSDLNEYFSKYVKKARQ